MHTRTTIARCTASLLLLAAWTSARTSAQTITEIGVLHGHNESGASGINGNGTAVCGYSAVTGGISRAIRWTSTAGILNLGTVVPTHQTSFAAAISDDGQIVVGESYTIGIGQPMRAFRWTQSTGMVGLPLGNFHDQAMGISADGSTILGQSNYYAVKWTNSGTTLTYLGQIGPTGASYSVGSNSNGSFIAGYGALNFYRQVGMWTPPAPPQIVGTVFPNDDTWVTSMSRDGGTVVGFSGYFSSTRRAMKWTPTTGLVDIGLATITPGDQTSFGAVTSEGIASLGWATYSGNQAAVHWTEIGGFWDLNSYLASWGVNLTGWTLTECTGVSADATALCGNGYFNGQKRGWVVRGLQPVCGALVYMQPQNVEACVGTTATLLTIAYAPTIPLGPGTGIKFQWARKYIVANVPFYLPLTNGPNGNGSTYGGVKTPNFTISNVQPLDAGEYVCLYDAGCGQTISLVATLTVQEGPPQLFFGPSDQSACSTGSVGFAAAATAANTPHSYQWECESPANSNTWVPITSGSTLPSFGVGGATVLAVNNPAIGIVATNSLNGLNNRKVRCAITNACGTTYTGSAIIKVCLGDANCDGIVDDSDFVDFALAYDLFDCADPNMPPGCPVDLNNDGYVDDADFVLFVNAYDSLLCP